MKYNVSFFFVVSLFFMYFMFSLLKKLLNYEIINIRG